MNQKHLIRTVALGILVCALGSLFFVLPALKSEAFLSPDETAVAVSARQFAETGRFSVPDPILERFPWLHPRSFVTRGSEMVPVGFLGMPFLAALFLTVFGEWGMRLFSPFLGLSAAVPLWFFAQRWGRLAQIAVVIAWLTFPTVILYANRGLFPNLPVVAFSLWAAWCVWGGRENWRIALAGFAAGLAIIIRPTEALWITSWIIAARIVGHGRSGWKTNLRDAVVFLIPFLAVVLFGGYLARETYGSPFVAGYQLRDPKGVGDESVEVGRVLAAANRSWFEVCPFGFHPRTMWFHVRSYFLGFLWPWTIVFASAVLISWRERAARPVFLAGAWTAAVILFMYGQGIYQDHVRPNHVSLANSFLRYALPVVPFLVLSLGRIVPWAESRIRPSGRYIAVIPVILLALFGLWTAFTRDDEGVKANYRELVRYDRIRMASRDLLGDGAIIVTDRSDKVFFPEARIAVQPQWYDQTADGRRPRTELIERLVRETDHEIAVFFRTLDPASLEAWRSAGVDLELLLEAGNESLYRVVRPET